MTRPNQRRPAFTLLEILLVLVILILLAAVAYPTLSGMYGDVRVKAAGDQVRAAWTEARSNAIEGGRDYRFSVQPGTGKFRVAPNSQSFWDGSNGASDPPDPNAPPPLVQEGELSGGIVFDVSSDLPSDGTWTTVVVFKSQGDCSADTEISLKEADDDGTPIVIRVRAMTGAISVRKKTGGQ
jgi:type II secretory pathway pseudopilin PulG